MVSRLPLARILVLAGVTILALSACGRRGALEPPPRASGAQAQTGSQQSGTLPSPVGTARKSRGMGFTVPQQPFILDPLL